MAVIRPDDLGERLRSDGEGLPVLEVRHQHVVETLASDVPDHPPNCERITRATAGREAIRRTNWPISNRAGTTVRPSEL